MGFELMLIVAGLVLMYATSLIALGHVLLFLGTAILAFELFVGLLFLTIHFSRKG